MHIKSKAAGNSGTQVNRGVNRAGGSQPLQSNAPKMCTALTSPGSQMTVIIIWCTEAFVLFSVCRVKTPWKGWFLCVKRMGVVIVVPDLEGHSGASGSKPHNRERAIPLLPKPWSVAKNRPSGTHQASKWNRAPTQPWRKRATTTDKAELLHFKIRTYGTTVKVQIHVHNASSSERRSSA